jgi:hypothetical protein
MLYQLSYTRPNQTFTLVQGVGFEPT